MKACGTGEKPLRVPGSFTKNPGEISAAGASGRRGVRKPAIVGSSHCLASGVGAPPGHKEAAGHLKSVLYHFCT
jgi:hypothetical protein